MQTWARIWRHSLFVPAVLVVFMGLLMLQTQRRVARVDTEPGFALDDSWIHASIARNLIAGRGYGINDGQWIPLSTSPAWTLLVAGGMLVFGNPVVAGLTAGFACQAGAVVLIYLLALRLTGHRFWAMVPAVLLTLNPILLWGYASGMELPMVALAVVLCFYVFDRTAPNSPGRMIGLPLALLLGVLSRPELFVLVPLAVLATAYQNRRGTPADLRTTLRIIWIQSAVFIAGILPYLLFNAATTGHLFPTAFHVKEDLRDVGILASAAVGDWSRVWRHLTIQSYGEFCQFCGYFIKSNAMLTLLAIPGFISFCHPFRKPEPGRAAMILSVVLFVPLIMGAVSPIDSLSNHAHRYLAPFVPAVTLLGSLGLWLLWSRLGQRIAAAACLLLVLMSTYQTYRPTLNLFARDVKNTNALYVESGKWIRDHVDPSIPIAVNDIGGISYFTENEVVDIMGLASPEIWPALEGTSTEGHATVARAVAIQRFLRENRVQYLVMSPQYYPSLDRQTDVFEPLMTWPAAFPTERSIDPQNLYRLHWD